MASLVVPVGVWRPSVAAVMDVCAVHSENRNGTARVFFGLRHGMVIGLRADPLRPEVLLAGHSSPVVGMAAARQPTDQPIDSAASGDAAVLVTLAQAGDVALWSLDEDGRCLLHNTMALGPAGDARGMLLTADMHHAVLWGGPPAAAIVAVVRLATLEVVAQTSLPFAHWSDSVRVSSPPSRSAGRLSVVNDEASPTFAESPRDVVQKSASIDIVASGILKSAAMDDAAVRKSASLDISGHGAPSAPSSAVPSAVPSPPTSRPPSVPSMGARPPAEAATCVTAGVWVQDRSAAVLFGHGAVYVVAINAETGSFTSHPRAISFADEHGETFIPRFAVVPQVIPAIGAADYMPPLLDAGQSAPTHAAISSSTTVSPDECSPPCVQTGFASKEQARGVAHQSQIAGDEYLSQRVNIEVNVEASGAQKPNADTTNDVSHDGEAAKLDGIYSPSGQSSINSATLAMNTRCQPAYIVASSTCLYACDGDLWRVRTVWRAPATIVQLTETHVRLASGAVHALATLEPVVHSIRTLFPGAPAHADVAITSLGALCYDARTVRFAPLARATKDLDDQVNSDRQTAEHGGVESVADKLSASSLQAEAGKKVFVQSGLFDVPDFSGNVFQCALDAEDVSGITCTAVWERESDARIVHGHNDGQIVVRALLDTACVLDGEHAIGPDDVGFECSAEVEAASVGPEAVSIALETTTQAVKHIEQDTDQQSRIGHGGMLPSESAHLPVIVRIDMPTESGGTRTLNVVDCREDETALDHVHQSAVTALSMLRGGMASGDAAGAVVFWEATADGRLEVRHRLHTHSAPVVAIIAGPGGQVDGVVTIDCNGGVSLVAGGALLGVVPARSGRPPVTHVRWSHDRRVALFYRDGAVRVWSLATLTAHDAPSRHADELTAFPHAIELPVHPTCAAGLGAAHASPVVCNGILGAALVWRTDAGGSGACGLRDGRLGALSLDVRRAVEALRARLLSRLSDGARLHAANVLLHALSFVFPWGAWADADAAALAVGLRPLRNDVVLGLVGANGNASYAYGAGRCATAEASLRVSAAALLAVPLDLGPQWAALRLAVLGSDPVSPVLSVVDGEGAWPNVPSPVSGRAPCHLAVPSLSFAAKYWHDASDELRAAGRAVFADALGHMSASALRHLVAHWRALLPLARDDRSASGGRRRMNRAAVVLGAVGVLRPDALDEGDRQAVADSLVALLVDERRHTFRGAAIELIGRGYGTVWARFLDAPPVFRLLHAWLASVSQAVDAHGRVLNVASRQSLGSVDASLGAIDASLGLDAANLGGHLRASEAASAPGGRGPSDGLQLIIPFESEAAAATLYAVRRTLLQLGLAAPWRVLVPWVAGPDYAGSRSLVERWSGASLLGEMLRVPDAAGKLTGLGVLFVEAAIRLLDAPAGAGVSRARLAALAAPLLADASRVFPTICYDAVHKRVIAAPDAPADETPADMRLRVYDLRGAGSSPSYFAGHSPLHVDCRTLEGHTRPATAVCAVGIDSGPWLRNALASAGADTAKPGAPPYVSVVSYSFGEAALRWWHVSASASSAGSSSVGPGAGGPAGGRLVATDVVAPALTEAAARFWAGRLGAALPVGFRWTADRLHVLFGDDEVWDVRVPSA